MLKPKVEAVQPEPHVPWEVDGNVLTVGTEENNIVIDLEERQTDSEVVIDLYKGSGGIGERDRCGSYVMSVKIPPKRYREEAAEPGNGGDFESGALVPEPLDIASVEILLWTAETNAADEE